MKVKNLKIGLILLFSSFNAISQSGINTKEPNNKTLLHISEKTSSTSNEVVSKGIMIPRLTQAQRDFINPTTEENSLMIFNTDENCYNFWNSSEEIWKSICGNTGNANFDFNCDNIEVVGQYSTNKELNINNYILIKNVNITKLGAYLISVNTDNPNGYSFSASGEFITTGIQHIKLYGQGIPTNTGTNTFEIVTSSDTQTTECNNVEITVTPQIANYNIDCGTATVNGTFTKGQSVSANTVSLKVTAQTTGSYHIYTEEVNGISFSKSGTFTTTGPQTILLEGSGTLISPDSFNLEINTNSAVKSTCSINISVLINAMKYGIIGSNSTYSWGSVERMGALSDPSNFGPNGKVKIASFTMTWQYTSVNDVINGLNQSEKPDIVLYNAYSMTPTTQLILALNDYVNAGGVLIYGTKDGDHTETNLLLDGIFGALPAGSAQRAYRQGGGHDDQDYKINNLPEDPIINGPFGNVTSYYWGEDNNTTGTILVRELPANSVQIATGFNTYEHTNNDIETSTVWYNNQKNFVYFGDSVGSANSTSNDAYPAFYRNNKPLVKVYGPGSDRNTIANSILEMNAVAWAIKKAATNGINTY